jgi:hypothetical protein
MSLLRNSRTLIEISLIAVMFALPAASGGYSNTNWPVASGSTSATNSTSEVAVPAATLVPSDRDLVVETIEPTLINTPSPVTITSSDFTLSSAQVTQYNLSQF